MLPAASILGVALLLEAVASGMVHDRRQRCKGRVTCADDDLCWRTSRGFARQRRAEQNGLPCGAPEIPPNRHESSAGGLHGVVRGECASWGMRRGTRRGDVKFAHGSLRRWDLYGVASDASSATMDEFLGLKKILNNEVD